MGSKETCCIFLLYLPSTTDQYYCVWCIVSKPTGRNSTPCCVLYPLQKFCSLQNTQLHNAENHAWTSFSNRVATRIQKEFEKQSELNRSIGATHSLVEPDLHTISGRESGDTCIVSWIVFTHTFSTFTPMMTEAFSRKCFLIFFRCYQRTSFLFRFGTLYTVPHEWVDKLRMVQETGKTLRKFSERQWGSPPQRKQFVLSCFHVKL